MELIEMTDRELVAEASYAVWDSSLTSSFNLNGDAASRSHERVDAAYAECERRHKPWLYQRAWNQAYREAGHYVSELDQAKASSDYWTGAVS